MKSQNPEQALVRTTQKEELEWKKLVEHFPTAPNSFVSNAKCSLLIALDGAGGGEVVSKLQHVPSSFCACAS